MEAKLFEATLLYGRKSKLYNYNVTQMSKSLRSYALFNCHIGPGADPDYSNCSKCYSQIFFRRIFSENYFLS